MESGLIDYFRSDKRQFLNLSLAAACLFLWFVFDGFHVQIALSRVHLELAVTDLRWQPQWPLLPWLTGAVSLLLAYGRFRLPRLAASGNEDLTRRLRLVSTFTAALLVIRLASLWQPVTYLFPFLGILWAPHGTWGLCLLHLLFLHFPFSPSAHSPSRLTDGWVAALLFIVGTTVYGFYTLYFCQVTMLHGDEGQYLRVTQSLLHDGDMDLANNLTREQTDEFHVLDFAVNQSPGSPPGKVHSQHPIGLSVGLLPAYWIGLELWQNPRLASALCMALLAAACLPVAFLWLRRLGVGRPLALLGVGILGTTSPFFLYSNQLYPEIPALLITFVVLLATTHWQIPGGGYRSWGRLEPLFLGLLLLLLACLPFLHPRYAPLLLLGGVPLLLQSWHSPQRRANLAGLGLVTALALSAQLSFNLALSDDWMGLFRPENYRGKAALDIATWAVSLPGHWLHGGKGLLNSSPVFLLSLLGCTTLLVARDRRLLLLGGLYLATAATNGLHPVWDLGFCYPARFMVTALPVLLYGLVLALPLVARSRVAFFLAAIALVVSLETIGNTVALTELGYDGRNLMTRQINQFYPWQIHFFPDLKSSLPLVDVSFWSILLAALFFLLVYPRPIPPAVRGGIALLAALLSFIWGRSDGITARLDAGASPYTNELIAGKATGQLGLLRHPLRPELMDTGMREPDGRLAARSPDHSGGYLGILPLPPLLPGWYRAQLPDLGVQVPPGQAAGHFYVARRYSLPDVSLWEDRFSQPLSGETANSGDLLFDAGYPLLGYAFVEFSGSGELSFSRGELGFSPVHRSTSTKEIYRRTYPEDERTEGPLLLGTRRTKLPPGQYRVRYVLEGSGFGAFFQRRPAPIAMAVYTAPAEVQSERYQLLAEFWLGRDRTVPYTIGDPTFIRPQVESIHPPWWLSVPFVGDRFFEQSFQLQEAGQAWILFSYAGPIDLRVKEVIIFRDDFLPL